MFSIGSVRTRLVLLVAVVAFLVGAGSGIFQLYSGGQAQTLNTALPYQVLFRDLPSPYNSKYGVLTEDKPLLNQTLEGAVSDKYTDVIGAVVRDVGGTVLAQRGAVIRDRPDGRFAPLPATPTTATMV